MRQSPSLLALLTISATLGFASQARGESLAMPTQEIGAHTVKVADLINSEDETVEFLETAAIRDRPSVEFLNYEPSLDAISEEEISNLPETASLDTDQTSETNTSALPPPPAETDSFISVHQLSQQPDVSERETKLSEEAISQIDEEQDVLEIDEDVLEGDEDEDSLEVDENVLEIDEDVLEDEDATPIDSELEDEAIPSETEQPEVELEVPETEEETDQQDPEEEEAAEETQVLVAEVAVAAPGDELLRPDLEDIVYDVIETTPGQTTTRTQIQRDINSIFATGFFANVRAIPTDTPLGVRVTFIAEPNPILTRVEVEGSQVLPEGLVDEFFNNEDDDPATITYGEILNLLQLQDGILELNNWYQENGYVLAQVIAAPQISDDGVVTLQVAEGVIEDIEIRFITEEGLAEDEEGNPIRGKTREFIITREFETEPGDVFQQGQIQSDLQRAFALGIFDDINLTLNPGRQDPRKVIVTVNVVERNTGSVAAGLGFNFAGDIFGTVSYRQDNFGGNNQKLSAEAQLSTSDLLFDVSFTDPWIGGDPFGTSYTVNGFARRSISLVFDGGPDEIDLPNGDDILINRLGGGISFRRPLGGGFTASLGARYQRVETTDEDGETFTEDEAGNPLTASDTGRDDLWTLQFGIVRDQRDDPLTPTRGSSWRLNTEQSIPIGSGSILFNRLRGSYSYYIPVSFLNFNEGPQALAFNIQGGTIIGDLPPYEAFALGGTNSVRGFDEGDLATGRSFLQASVEYRFPLFSFLGGALFLDAGTDLGTGDNVPGSPGPDRGRPGSGFGYGAGVRVQTPLGPIRLDFGISDDGDSQLHFGIGERF